MPIILIERLRQRGSLFLFLLSTSLHLLVIIYGIYFKKNLPYLLLLESVFYLINSKAHLKKVLRIGIIAIIIFIINLISYEGKIILTISFIKITEQGLKEAYFKAAVILLLFLYSNTVFFMNKDFLIGTLKKVNNSLVSRTIEYFFYFVDMIYEKKIKNIISTAILVYHRPLENLTSIKAKKPTLIFYISNIFLLTAYLIGNLLLK